MFCIFSATSTDQIQFQEITGDAQVYIGTPLALEKALTKARGVAGQEMTKGEREFMVLDGGFNFEYLVLDEVHTLNGPEGDALQRIIQCTQCPILALSATIGNAVQLRDWFKNVVDRHLKTIDANGNVSLTIMDMLVIMNILANVMFSNCTNSRIFLTSNKSLIFFY